MTVLVTNQSGNIDIDDDPFGNHTVTFDSSNNQTGTFDLSLQGGLLTSVKVTIPPGNSGKTIGVTIRSDNPALFPHPVAFTILQSVTINLLLAGDSLSNLHITLIASSPFTGAIEILPNANTAVGTVSYTNIPTVTISADETESHTNNVAVCFVGNTKVMMANRTLKPISKIVSGDHVLSCVDSHKTSIVNRVIAFKYKGRAYNIPSRLIGNNEKIICTNHPIWCNNGKNRIMPKHIKGVTLCKINETVYDIQFEDEGTFYANYVKVDSASPSNILATLPKFLYKDETKYLNNMYTSEDDERRNKPPMTKHCDNVQTYIGNTQMQNTIQNKKLSIIDRLIMKRRK